MKWCYTFRLKDSFEYDYKFKGDSYTNSINFPEDLWNLSVDSLYAYKGKKIEWN